MALHILNLSVDTSNTSLRLVSGDAALNEIHSLIEFVLEDVFCLHNAVPESSNHHETPELTEASDDFIPDSHTIFLPRHEHLVSHLRFAPADCFFVQPTLDITSPPPKA
jgi:hypothetical protein